MKLEDCGCIHCKYYNTKECAYHNRPWPLGWKRCGKFTPKCGVWIDINEMQPDKYEDVIARNERGYIGIGPIHRLFNDTYTCECFNGYETYNLINVTRWTSLPDD